MTTSTPQSPSLSLSPSTSSSPSLASTRPTSLATSPDLPSSARSPSPTRPLPAALQPVQASPVSAAASGSSEKLVPDLLKPVGCLADDEYEKLMPSWRVRLRQIGVEQLKREMGTLAWIQTQCRTPASDVYFVQTSLLGTHTFFMTFIPMWFWFGYGNVGRGLLYVLAATGYLTSVLKDLCCIPRPYSPPVTRLSVGNHALEYGFPSTHSANSISMALYFAELIYRHNPSPTALNLAAYAFLGVMAFSVVFGRLYCGMHSLTDVAVGSGMGVAIWGAHWVAEGAIERFTMGGSWGVTGTMIPATLFLVFVHPAPAEDCPCFEDAVAFVSVVCGIVVGRTWSRVDYVEHTLGAVLGAPWTTPTWAAAVLGKLVIGVATIFTWRLVAKEVCHAILPPTFRFFSSYLLPRRHYLVATEYDAYNKTDGLHPVPSLLDLPTLGELEGKTHTETTGHNQIGTTGTAGQIASELRQRAGPAGRVRQRQREGLAAELVGRKAGAEDKLMSKAGEGVDTIKRDADVLTKLIVYSGIGYLATISVPAFFVCIGLSV